MTRHVTFGYLISWWALALNCQSCCSKFQQALLHCYVIFNCHDYTRWLRNKRSMWHTKVFYIITINWFTINDTTIMTKNRNSVQYIPFVQWNLFQYRWSDVSFPVAWHRLPPVTHNQTCQMMNYDGRLCRHVLYRINHAHINVSCHSSLTLNFIRPVAQSVDSNATHTCPMGL